MARVLLIDDDSTVRRGIRRVLEVEGHEVMEAEDGRCLRTLDPGTRLDLVITDINMPEVDGIEVITMLAERDPPPPVIAVSGGGRMPKEVLLSNAGLLGAVRTLAKPFDVAVLVSTLREVLDGGASGSGVEAPEKYTL